MWLITGSRGYLGRHLTSQLNSMGVTYIGIDRQTGHNLFPEKEIVGDYSNHEFIQRLLLRHNFSGVIHLAALKDVSAAILNPESYLKENLQSSISFFDQLASHGVTKSVFASSAAVYGNQNTEFGFKESDQIAPSNAYGESKALFEEYLKNWTLVTQGSVISLRFFNLGGTFDNLGADLEGTNLIPKILRFANEQKVFGVFGDKFPTNDGTAERDYIHVADVVSAIQKSIEVLGSETGIQTFNIGTGRPISVIQVIEKMTSLLEKKIEITFETARTGDSYRSFANIEKAVEGLGWSPQRSFEDIVSSYEVFGNK